MQKSGELKILDELYGYRCRHQEEFKACLSPLKRDYMIFVFFTSNAISICLCVLHTG